MVIIPWHYTAYIWQLWHSSEGKLVGSVSFRRISFRRISIRRILILTLSLSPNPIPNLTLSLSLTLTLTISLTELKFGELKFGELKFGEMKGHQLVSARCSWLNWFSARHACSILAAVIKTHLPLSWSDIIERVALVQHFHTVLMLYQTRGNCYMMTLAIM